MSASRSSSAAHIRNTDATGYHPVLVIEFDEAANADDVEVSIDCHQD